jgi:hypothetical protein
VTFYFVESVWRHDGARISESSLFPRSMVILAEGNSTMVENLS